MPLLQPAPQFLSASCPAVESPSEVGLNTNSKKKKNSKNNNKNKNNRNNSNHNTKVRKT